MRVSVPRVRGTLLALPLAVFPRSRQDSGFSAIELLIVLAIVGSMAAIGLPLSSRHDRRHQDPGRRAGSVFRGCPGQTDVRSQVHALTAVREPGDQHVSHSDLEPHRNTPGWVDTNEALFLSDRSQFGFGSATVPPPNTQVTLAQAPMCRDDLNVEITSTACVIFNSRGVSVTAAGPAGHDSGPLSRGPLRDLRNHPWGRRSASGVAHDTSGSQLMEATVRSPQTPGRPLPRRWWPRHSCWSSSEAWARWASWA